MSNKTLQNRFQQYYYILLLLIFLNPFDIVYSLAAALHKNYIEGFERNFSSQFHLFLNVLSF